MNSQANQQWRFFMKMNFNALMDRGAKKPVVLDDEFMEVSGGEDCKVTCKTSCGSTCTGTCTTTGTSTN